MARSIQIFIWCVWVDGGGGGGGGEGGGGEVDTSPAVLGCSCLDLVCQAESIHIVFGHESVLELLLVNSLAHKLTMMVQTLFHYSIRRGKRIVYQHK